VTRLLVLSLPGILFLPSEASLNPQAYFSCLNNESKSVKEASERVNAIKTVKQTKKKAQQDCCCSLGFLFV